MAEPKAMKPDLDVNFTIYAKPKPMEPWRGYRFR